MNNWRSWIYGGPNKDGRFVTESFVYVLLGPNNLCKIGHTRNPVWRTRAHRHNCTSPLELICLVRLSDKGDFPRAADLAKRIHRYFETLGRELATIEELDKLGWHQRSRFYRNKRQFEWFWLTDEDVTWLRGKTTEEVDCCEL